jgi:hypothetical protein
MSALIANAGSCRWGIPDFLARGCRLFSLISAVIADAASRWFRLLSPTPAMSILPPQAVVGVGQPDVVTFSDIFAYVGCCRCCRISIFYRECRLLAIAAVFAVVGVIMYLLSLISMRLTPRALLT